MKKKHAIVIGSGSILERAVDMIKTNNLGAYSLKGVLLEGENESEQKANQSFCHAHDINVLATPNNWADFFVQYPCHILLIALPSRSYSFWIKT